MPRAGRSARFDNQNPASLAVAELDEYSDFYSPKIGVFGVKKRGIVGVDSPRATGRNAGGDVTERVAEKRDASRWASHCPPDSRYEPRFSGPSPDDMCGCRDNRTSAFLRSRAPSSGRGGSETAILKREESFSEDFKTGAFSHSATSPRCRFSAVFRRESRVRHNLRFAALPAFRSPESTEVTSCCPFRAKRGAKTESPSVRLDLPLVSSSSRRAVNRQDAGPVPTERSAVCFASFRAADLPRFMVPDRMLVCSVQVYTSVAPGRERSRGRGAQPLARVWGAEPQGLRQRRRSATRLPPGPVDGSPADCAA